MAKIQTNLYFYHLGSSSWITDSGGHAIQHLQYLPFGETRVDQRTTSWNSRYSFSAKEKDEESGYGYFGARYYDSDISIWLSVDPMSDKYPYQTPYLYCGNNPLKIIDPNGEDEYFNEMGVYLGADAQKSDNVRIIKQDTWNTQKENMSFTDNAGSTFITAHSQEDANLISTIASEANLSDKASLNIYQHYNDTGAKLTAISKNEENGTGGMRTSGDGKTIAIRIDGNKKTGISNHFNEIKNVFVHEKQHISDIKRGVNMTDAQAAERRAVSTQMAHSTFNLTRPSFQEGVKKYGRLNKMSL